VSGTGFRSGCRIAINGIDVPNTRFRSRSKVVAKGPGLKAMVPKGVPVQMTATNLDGTASAPVSFTR
jgi:hypothetical protein